MDHPTDKQLDVWLRLRDSLLPEEAASVEGHVQSCRMCIERVETLKAYYEDLERELDQEPGERERTIASKIYQPRSRAALPSSSLIQTYEAPLDEYRKTLPVQFVNYIRRHPVGSVSVTMGSVFLAILLIFIQPWQGMDKNPAYAEVERNVLHTYDKQGELLWSMPAAGIPNQTTSENVATRDTKRFIRIEDIDGNGENEVLLTGSDHTTAFATDTLYVFNADGTLRWRQGPPPPVLFGDRTHTLVSNWTITDFFTLGPPKEPSRLFVIANSNWFPSVFFELDVNTGEILQSYWNAGWIMSWEVYPNGDEGKELIFLGAINNSYQHAALIVLNPDNINGHSPVKASNKPETLTRADELHYIMFPPSPLNRRFGNRFYNEISRIRLARDGTFQVGARENLHKLETTVDVLYTLDTDFNVLEAYGSAVYQKLYSDLYHEGELKESPADRFWEDLRDSVLYWDGEQFVNEPVKAE